MRTISTKNRISKKYHKCDLCGMLINPGELYNLQVQVDQGEMYALKAHLSCIDIAKKLDMWDNADDGLTLDIFQESINEEYNSILKSKGFKGVGLTFSQILDYVKTFHLSSLINK
jgi:hypothetical protein